ncbi:MAG TPA: lysylphosphatidylglycerol synthase domain-containing protein [Vicinamibacterales bacterium]|nr:lysylphosphatidylglycerol synthase domain-containing protein [Vicinamibacterales bacterium]
MSSPAPRRPAGRWLTYGIAAVLLVAVAAHVSGTREELANLQRISIEVLLLTGVLQFGSQIFLNGSLLLPIQACVTGLGFWELYLVRTGGLAVGSLVPVAGGLAVRLAYLRTLGLTYLDFAWATLFSNVLALGAAAMLAAGATAALWMMAGRPPWPLLVVLGGVLLLSIGALGVLEILPWLARHPRFHEWGWLSGLNQPRSARRMAGPVFALSLVRHLLNFVTFGVLWQALAGGGVGVLTGGIVYALTSPVRIVNITPGNLGINEWVVALVGNILAFDLTTGFLVALVFRGVGIVAQGVGALVASAYLAYNRPP